jgi:hypothetical protein
MAVANLLVFIKEEMLSAQGTAGISEKFRERRMKLFLKLAECIPRPATLLDVGGTVSFWRGCIPEGFGLTLINVFDQEPLEGMRVVIGDACDLSQFESRSFDVVFSNSVLGHVGSRERQQQMANEVRRVGRRYFVQTPNQRFPLDWRTLVPFFHWLSPSVQAWCFKKLPVGRYKKVQSSDLAIELATRVRNVTAAEMRNLFPDGTLVPERVFGLTKSFMMHTMHRVDLS